MIGLISYVFLICFCVITGLVTAYCILFGAKKEMDTIDDSIKMKRFIRKYQNHVDGIKDESGIIYKN